MSQVVAIAPVRKSVRVNAPPERAFTVFTAGMARWWLKSHSINPTKSPFRDIVMEPRPGGRWFERGEDGSECDWGRVLAWEPPGRVLLTWQIDASWQFDAGLVTELEIRFTAEAGGTTVTLEHRHLERMGETAETIRQQLDSGWPKLLESMATSAAS